MSQTTRHPTTATIAIRDIPLLLPANQIASLPPKIPITSPIVRPRTRRFGYIQSHATSTVQDNGETTWKQIALFLFTFGVLTLCALVLRPFLSAIVGAIVLAVVTLLLVVLSIISPAFFLAQHLVKQAVSAAAGTLLQFWRTRTASPQPEA